MREYIKKNIIPIIIEAIFITSCFVVPKQYFIYTNFIFYLLLFVYFYAKKEFSFREWFDNLKSGKKFWKSTIITLLFLALALMTTVFLENAFPNLDAGTIDLKRDSWLKLIIFAISTMFFPAFTEEIFYRKNLISFKNKKILLITAILGMFLYSIEHSLTIWGIFLTMIWALPFSVSYIKTKNIYIPMTAHFIGNLLGNGISVVMAIISML